MPEMLMELIGNSEDTQYGKYLTFILEKEVYAIEIRHVTEIIGIQKISALPEVANYMKGIINLRGKIIPVVDMRLRLKKESSNYTNRTCIIITDIQEMSVGLIVDHVNEVVSIPDSAVVSAAELHTGNSTHYIKGIGKVGEEIRLLLDCSRLFKSDELLTYKQNL